MKFRLFCCGAAVGMIFCCGMIPEVVLSEIPTVEVAAIETFEIQPEITCTGIIEAENSCQLVISSGAVIQELLVEEGSVVTAGTLIAKVEPNSALSSAVLVCPSEQDAVGLNGYSAEQLAALAQLSGMDASSLPDSLKNLSASMDEISKLEFPSAEEISAPVTGKVIQLAAKEGEYIAPGSSLCTILGTDSYLATVQVPADRVDDISIGDIAEISGGEINEQQLLGTVCSIGSTVSRSLQGTAFVSMVDVGIRIYPKTEEKIRHGAGVQCRILTGTPKQCMAVPYECVQQNEQNQEFVFLVSENGLSAVPVTTGVELDEQVEITGELAPGDLLAMTGEVPEYYFLRQEEKK